MTQLAKIPELIHHYSEHQTHRGHLHFLDFINDHYPNQENESSHSPEHEKLPFGECHASVSMLLNVWIPNVPVLMTILDADTSVKAPIIKSNAPEAPVCGAVWQPPKQLT